MSRQDHEDLKSTTTGDTNPKKRHGVIKASMSTTPKSALLYLGKVMNLGAEKYGPFNWRENHVDALTYIDAIQRHIDLWESGQDNDPPVGIDGKKGSNVTHLAHIMACCAILIDAQENGALVDNRHKTDSTENVMRKLFEQASA